MKRVAPERWFAGRPSVQVHDDGPEVACRLTPRARALAEIVVLVWSLAKRGAIARDRPAVIDVVSRCARAEGIEIIDFSPRLLGAPRGPTDIDLHYGPSHMNRAGYRMLVESITEQF